MPNKGLDLATNDLKIALITVINNSGVPISTVQLVLAGIVAEVNDQTIKAINEQKEAYEREMNENGNK